MTKVDHAMLAKIKLVEAVDSLQEAIGTDITKQAVNRVCDLLAGRWSAESKKSFIEANHY